MMGDYGPDAGSTNPDRGPQGSVEYNVVKEPGFYGWPYCIRENVPYNDITYTTDAGAGTNNGKYNCAAPVNDSPNNTGLTNLPAAIPASMWMGYTEADVRFQPDLGTGGAPTGGPIYRYDEDSTSDTKFPKFYDGQWFIGEWNNDWIKTATLNNEGLPTGVACFAICTGYISPMDIEFGPNGSLYVVEWGQGFAENNADSGVYRIDYVSGERLPIASGSVDVDTIPVGGTVNFSSAGSRDPDGTEITFAWDFKDGTTSTEPNPTKTFTTAGTYDVTLTVTDESGATSVDTVRVVVGNERPVVTIVTPENGKVADFGDTVAYEVSVVDPDGGAGGTPLEINAGDPECADIRVEVKLGHDTHAHELSNETGCVGDFTITGADGHGHRGQRLHRAHGQLHRRRQRAGGRCHRHGRGDPPAQAQAGGVLVHHGPPPDRLGQRRSRRHRRGDDRRRRRHVRGLHRGRRLDLVQPLQPRGPRQGHVPRLLRRRGRHHLDALRRPGEPGVLHLPADHPHGWLADVA